MPSYPDGRVGRQRGAASVPNVSGWNRELCDGVGVDTDERLVAGPSDPEGAGCRRQRSGAYDGHLPYDGQRSLVQSVTCVPRAVTTQTPSGATARPPGHSSPYAKRLDAAMGPSADRWPPHSSRAGSRPRRGRARRRVRSRRRLRCSPSRDLCAGRSSAGGRRGRRWPRARRTRLRARSRLRPVESAPRSGSSPVRCGRPMDSGGDPTDPQPLRCSTEPRRPGSRLRHPGGGASWADPTTRSPPRPSGSRRRLCTQACDIPATPIRPRSRPGRSRVRVVG